MEYIPPLDLSDNASKKKKVRIQNFSERLKFALRIRNMSQAELCKKADVHKSAMSQYVNGAFEPRRKQLERIAKALNVNEPWLMGWDVPFTEHNGTPETSNATKLSDNKNWRQKTIDILYKQMDFLSQESENTCDSMELSCLSNSMSKIAEILLKYLEK